MPFEITRTELVWPGKCYEDGNLVQVERVNLSFQVIDDYPDDTPYRSCLVFARTRRGRPVHAVCAHVPEEDKAIIITVYEPDPDRWIDFGRRIVS